MNRDNVEKMMHYFMHGGRRDALFNMDTWMCRDVEGGPVCGCIAMHVCLQAIGTSPERLWDRLPAGPSGGEWMIDVARGFLGLSMSEAVMLFQGFGAYEARTSRKVTMRDAADMMQMMLNKGWINWAVLSDYQLDLRYNRNDEMLKALLKAGPEDPEDDIEEPDEEPDNEDDITEEDARLVAA